MKAGREVIDLTKQLSELAVASKSHHDALQIVEGRVEFLEEENQSIKGRLLIVEKRVELLEEENQFLRRENSNVARKFKDLGIELESLKEKFGQKAEGEDQLMGAVTKAALRLHDLQGLRSVGLRKFLEFSRFKVQQFCGMNNGNYVSRGPNEWLFFVENIHGNPDSLMQLEQEGLNLDTLEVLSYGFGSLQSTLSKAAHVDHLDKLVNSQSLGLGVTNVQQAQAFSTCIAVCPDEDSRKKMDKLFQFCFKMGSYLLHLE